jgi:hypothetical protein
MARKERGLNIAHIAHIANSFPLPLMFFSRLSAMGPADGTHEIIFHGCESWRPTRRLPRGCAGAGARWVSPGVLLPLRDRPAPAGVLAALS